MNNLDKNDIALIFEAFDALKEKLDADDENSRKQMRRYGYTDQEGWLAKIEDNYDKVKGMERIRAELSKLL